jgi:hypothetical protein
MTEFLHGSDEMKMVPFFRVRVSRMEMELTLYTRTRIDGRASMILIPAF